MRGSAPDVLVLGEVLVELSSLEPLGDGVPLRLGFSGDALNVAAAAAAGGAHTCLLARVPGDELGDALVARVAELGVDTTALVRGGGQHGVYFTHADPDGERHFVYVRQGSAGSQLEVADLDDGLLSRAGVVVASGVACAISTSAAQAVRHAAERARRFVYDPNFRPRLTSASAAADVLRRLAPYCDVVTPSWPGEARQLLDLGDDASEVDAIRAVTGMGARGVVLTCGPRGAVVATAGQEAPPGTGAQSAASAGSVVEVPGVRAADVVDQTGAGDCLTGTLAARLALGDDLVEAVRLGVAAASLSVQGRGGTGHVPTLEQTRATAAAVAPREGKDAR